MTITVLGVDPGSAVTGYGIVESDPGRPGSLVECGVLRTSSRSTLADRITEIYDGMSSLIARHDPDIVAVETVFYAKNVRTTVSLGHARAVVLLAARKAHKELREYSPATVKRTITGSGRAAKEQVGFMVQRLLKLEEPPKPDDAADGVALALTCLLSRRPAR